MAHRRNSPYYRSRKAIQAEYTAPIEKEKKLLPFGYRARLFANRDPKYDARINILVGAVRASKTWAVMMKILKLSRYNIAGHRVLTGVSKQAIYQNVLSDLFDIVGEENYSYNRQSGELNIFGAKWLVIGARDEGSEKSIRGMTIGVVVSDELVLMPRNFFMMLLSRMSPPGARMYATTNPADPYHWVKAEVLDNPRLVYGLGRDLWWETWTMDDNPNLSQDFIDFTKRSYVGVFFQRFILGLWVLAEGAIYRNVLNEGTWYDDATRPITLLSRGGHAERWLAIDWGTINSFVALDIYNDGFCSYVERELYWDSVVQAKQKTNSEYADDLIKFIGAADPRDAPGIILDPSAASFRVELLARGMYVIDADNEVDDGIRKVSAALGNQKLKIHRRCVNTRREMETYAWDTKKAEGGKEQPIKAHDHSCDAIRYYINTRINSWSLATM